MKSKFSSPQGLHYDWSLFLFHFPLTPRVVLQALLELKDYPMALSSSIHSTVSFRNRRQKEEHTGEQKEICKENLEQSFGPQNN